MKKLALRKGTKVFRWNGVSDDSGVVIKKSKEYLHVDWNGTEERVEADQFKYQMKIMNDSTELWRWKAPAIEANQILEKKIEGDWENTYDHIGKCISMRLLSTVWFLEPVHEFLTEQGYTVTEEEANLLQNFIEGKWVDTYYWFCSACSERKELGSEIIKWMVGPLKEIINEKLGLKYHVLRFHALDFSKLVASVVDKKITGTMGKDVLNRMNQGEKIEEILKDDKYKISSGDDMAQFVKNVIDANPTQVADLKSGQNKILSWLVGQIMKASKGKANAGEANRMIREELEL